MQLRFVRGKMEPTRTPCGVELRQIDGYPIYWAGLDGSIWSCRNTRWRRLKTSSVLGYQVVSLYRGGRQTQTLKKVHQLVLRSFIGPPEDGQMCRHLDGDKTNNCLSNLAWGTNRENAADRLIHGTHLCGENHPSAKLTDKQVEEALRLLAQGHSQSSVGKAVGCNQQNISRIAAGKRRKTRSRKCTA